MKKLNNCVYTAVAVLCFHFANAQLCTGTKGPNLLGAKGTFSAPYITVNTNASSCLTDGSNTYNPSGNVGNALTGCTSTIGNTIPCSDYTYTDQESGMQPEFTYSILKVMGDKNGSNCIHNPIWKAADHTGDGGYFLAVNGAPNTSSSPLFYQIKHIPVCSGTTYEFAAWVISMIPGAGGTDAASPNISFVVNGQTIATSGPIAYNNIGRWVQVGGTFTATTDFVDLQVINATSVAQGNDLGLDDITIRVCQSRIAVSGPVTIVEGMPATAHYIVTDPLNQNTWYKIQFSSDGGSTFNNITSGDQFTYGPDHTDTINYPIFGGIPLTAQMNGYQFRLVVSTTKAGLENPDCLYFNDYRAIVASGAPLPVQLRSFNGGYANGVATLTWKTSQEINSDHFELFKSTDGNNFKLAAKIAAAGNSSIEKNYQYNDNINAGFGANVFYKLKQVDIDDNYIFSSVIRLALGNKSDHLSLFPNPVKNNVTLTFNAPKTSVANTTVRNTNGQKVFEKTIDVLKGNNSSVINVATLQPGIYYITIANADINYTERLQKL